ncbi:hypothetical protein SAMN03159489_05982 [Pseudomonas sp. NFPP07]|uniref:hypothetical protein n=1 Tax=Pseudomonas sp. NFPP07 TaxID=1566213 RepID=UPI0008E9D73D|nr:hypothetical protein [Pseudomonas sp. NFPP07]SFQ82560.1 hypothetical protein SAMN03159489_05982 [Pseudomonas sp. NFPP07]
MRLINARQAWHDALHESRSSVMAVAAEQARLGKKSGAGEERVVVMLENEHGQETAKSYAVRSAGVHETRPGRRLTESRCAHMLIAGLIMRAIDTLPKSIRHLGHFLYSPMATGNDLSIAHGLAWLGSGLDTLPERKRERAYWMALAALQSHKRMVQGRPEMGPGEVCMFVEDRTGTSMDPHNWVRDWAGIWSTLASHIDKLDAKALRPVAVVVAEMCEEENAA